MDRLHPLCSFDVAYSFFLLFWRIVINIFFREIRPRGAHNIPRSGAVILVAAPHANQFLDSFLLMSEVYRETQRKVEFLTAAKSMRRKLVGTLAQFMSAIPVERAADAATSGSGFIALSENDSRRIIGFGTRFTSELRPKSRIMFPKSLNCISAEVTEIISDTELMLKDELVHNDDEMAARVQAALSRAKIDGDLGLPYKCMPHLDQREMYRFVCQRLHDGGCIGIFPEGGSHDRTDLLPLKAGAAIIALEVMARDPSTKVKIVPAGLSYFHAHKFRSRVVIEFGSAMDVPFEWVELYKQGGSSKRQACSALLDLIYNGLKTVTLRAPDYETLMVAQAARRLYQIPGQHLTLSQVVQLNKRFLEAYLRFKDDERIQQLKRDVLKYNRTLRDLGLRDHQIPRAKASFWKNLSLLTYRSGLLCFWSTLALPGVILNGPIFFLGSVISRRKARDALAESSVKVAGRDVLGSWKAIVSLIAAPLLYFVYAFLAFFIASAFGASTKWLIATLCLTLCTLPILSCAALKFGEAGVDVLKSLRPLAIALFPGQQAHLDEIKKTRQRLSKELDLLINELAPQLWSDFDMNKVLVPAARAPWSISGSDLRQRRGIRRTPDAQGDLLTHPMTWLDEYLFGWNTSEYELDSYIGVMSGGNILGPEERGDLECIARPSRSSTHRRSIPCSA